MEHRDRNNSAIQEYMQLLGYDQTQFSTLILSDKDVQLLIVSLVLLLAIIIIWRYIRYSRSKAARDGNNSRTIQGKVGGFQSRTEETQVYGPKTKTKTIWTFRIERFDAEGNRQPPVPVQMAARSFDGFVTDGDRVRVYVGSWKPGRILKPTSLYNEETQSFVKTKDCFIATAVFGDPDAMYVQTLRTYRDRHLQKNVAGQYFIALYYRLSPFLAGIIARSNFARGATRLLLKLFVEQVCVAESTDSERMVEKH